MTLKGWAVAAGLVLLRGARQRCGDGGRQFLRGLCTRCGLGGNAEPGRVPWTKAFLHAESSALSQRSAERVRQLGTRVAGSHVGLIYRRVVQVPERTLSLYLISLINRCGERHEQVTDARGRRSAGRCLRRYDPNSATGADRDGHRRRRRCGDWRDRRERRARSDRRGGSRPRWGASR